MLSGDVLIGIGYILRLYHLFLGAGGLTPRIAASGAYPASYLNQKRTNVFRIITKKPGTVNSTEFYGDLWA